MRNQSQADRGLLCGYKGPRPGRGAGVLSSRAMLDPAHETTVTARPPLPTGAELTPQLPPRLASEAHPALPHPARVAGTAASGDKCPRPRDTLRPLLPEPPEAPSPLLPPAWSLLCSHRDHPVTAAGPVLRVGSRGIPWPTPRNRGSRPRLTGALHPSPRGNQPLVGAHGRDLPGRPPEAVPSPARRPATCHPHPRPAPRRARPAWSEEGGRPRRHRGRGPTAASPCSLAGGSPLSLTCPTSPAGVN